MRTNMEDDFRIVAQSPPVRPVNRRTILTLDINQRSGSPEVHLAVDAIMHGIIFQLTEAVSTGGLRFSFLRALLFIAQRNDPSAGGY
jgi:hypothetical protein